MLEHVTISSPSQQAARRDAGKGGGAADVFASLLGTATDPRAATETSCQVGTGPNATNEPGQTDRSNDRRAVLKDLADRLRDLEDDLEAGREPDPDDLDRIADDLDRLEETLADGERRNGTIKGLGTAAGIAAAILAPGIGPLVSAAAGAVGALAGGGEVDTPPILAELAGKLTGIAGEVRGTNADLANRLVDLAEKLGAGKLPADAVADLGLGTDAGFDADLEAAIRSLGARPSPSGTADAPQPDPDADVAKLALTADSAKSPALATPQLKSPADAAPVQPAAPQPTTEAAPRPAARPDLEVEAAKTVLPAGSKAAADAVAAASPDASTAGADTADPAAPPAPPPPTSQPAQAAPRAVAGPYQAPQVSVPQLAFELARQIQKGASHFQIRLDPPELGRIDVHMKVDAAGNLNARLAVERSETLDLLQRDQRGLEKALAQAGLDGGKTSLEFSLRQNPFDRQPGGGNAPGWTAAPTPTAIEAEASAAPVVLYRGVATPGGVNLFV